MFKDVSMCWLLAEGSSSGSLREHVWGWIVLGVGGE